MHEFAVEWVDLANSSASTAVAEPRHEPPGGRVLHQHERHRFANCKPNCHNYHDLCVTKNEQGDLKSDTVRAGNSSKTKIYFRFVPETQRL